MNINVPDLSSIPHDNDHVDDLSAQKFSWKAELESIEKDMIDSVGIIESVDDYNCTARVKTLEGDELELECSLSKGIKVVKTTGDQDYLGKVYESLESLLMKISPKYLEAFCTF